MMVSVVTSQIEKQNPHNFNVLNSKKFKTFKKKIIVK